MKTKQNKSKQKKTKWSLTNLLCVHIHMYIHMYICVWERIFVCKYYQTCKHFLYAFGELFSLFKCWFLLFLLLFCMQFCINIEWLHCMHAYTYIHTYVITCADGYRCIAIRIRVCEVYKYSYDNFLFRFYNHLCCPVRIRLSAIGYRSF